MASLLSKKKKHDVDMTEGSINRHIIMFSVPLLIGNLFQILYNTVDTWIVGNFVSDAAFSAVGTVGPALNMMIAFAMGLGAGASVVIAQYYGAHDYENVNKAVHTAIMAAAILGGILAVAGVALLPSILKLMRIPEDILPQSRQYLLILYATMIPPVVYNMGAGILRAIGDSSRPFYFLVISCLANIVMDLLFVIKFQWGVAGVAWATTLAQLLSCIMVLVTLVRADSMVKLELKKMRIDSRLLKQIIDVGVPSGIRMTITSFSNLFVQAYINAFGSAVMGGWTAYNKIAQFVQLPIQTLATALSTFVGQNLGKNRTDRAKKSVRNAIIMTYSFCLVAGGIVCLAAPGLVGFFNSNPQIMANGVYFLRHILPVYFLLATYQMISSALSGAGNAKVPMFAMLIGGVACRQLYLYAFTHLFPGEILVVTYAYPVGWFIAGAILLVYYSRVDLGKTRLVGK